MTDARTRESYRDAATAIAACLVLGACSEDKPERAIPTLDAEYAGCAAVYAGPVCTLTTDAREIVFWAEVPRGTAFRVRAGDEALAAAQEYIEGGVQVRATIPENATEVVLERMENNEVASAFKLPIRPDDTPTEITEALALRGEGKFDEAEAKLAPLLESEETLPKTQARSTLARIELARGNHERAAEIFEETSDQLYTLGALSLSVRDSFALSHIRAYEQWRLADAQRTLVEAAERASDFAYGAAGTPLYQARVAERLGDARSALALLRRAKIQARRAGLTQLECHSIEFEAIILDTLGRDEEAVATLETARPLLDQLSSCDRADYHTNVAWMHLSDAETRSTSHGITRSAAESDPTQALETALREYSGGCPRADMVANAHVNLAFAALQRSDLDTASDHLRQARDNTSGWTMSAGWATLLEARLAARRGETSTALLKYGELVRRAEAAGALGDLWRALVGRAHLLRDLSRRADAIRDLEMAEATIDELTRRIAIGDGRESFAGDRDLSARLLADARMASGDGAGALSVMRHARRRAIRSVHRTERLSALAPATATAWTNAVAGYWRARNRVEHDSEAAWTSSGEDLERLVTSGQSSDAELAHLLDAAFASIDEHTPTAIVDDSPVPPSAVELSYFPAESAWIGFARTGTRVRAASLERLPPNPTREDLSERLLEPFRPELDQATAVELITYGELDGIDFASLPWNGTALIQSKSVVHRVDLASTRAGLPPTERALVISDSRGDLPAAAREGTQLMTTWERRGIEVEALGGRRAQLSAVLSALPRADLLHYAGHGQREGRGDWRSSLALAGNDELSLGDVLALPSVPREVVIAACDVGATTDAVAGVAGMNLARAFVASGAEAVVAALEPVSDELAVRFSVAYHRARATASPEASFRSAALEVEPSGRVPYRLFVP